MKILLALFSLFFSIGSYAQLNSDTIPTRFKRVVFVVDGSIVSREKANKVDVFDKIVILNSDYGKNIYVNNPADTVYVIATKKGAISAYQKKLSAFSKVYKKEVELQMKYNHNDNGIFYQPMINDKGEIYTEDERIRMLYNIPASKIKKVEVHKQHTCCGTNIYVTVITKK